MKKLLGLLALVVTLLASSTACGGISSEGEAASEAYRLSYTVGAVKSEGGIYKVEVSFGEKGCSGTVYFGKPWKLTAQVPASREPLASRLSQTAQGIIDVETLRNSREFRTCFVADARIDDKFNQ